MLEKEMRVDTSLSAQLKDNCTVPRLRANKLKVGRQHGWVAVEKHEMPSWINTIRHRHVEK